VKGKNYSTPDKKSVDFRETFHLFL